LSIEITLFVLRLASGAALLLILALLFVFLWRDYRSATSRVEASKRSYGRLIELTEIDGVYTPVGETHALLPLTSIGRSPTNTIPIRDSFASGEHAVLAMRSGQWWLEDRQSRNGTTLNGMPVTQSIIITDGDIIGIGKLHFRVELEA